MNNKVFSSLLTAAIILTSVSPTHAGSPNLLTFNNSLTVTQEELISACKSFDAEWQKFLGLNSLSVEQIEVVNVKDLHLSVFFALDNPSYKPRNICVESGDKFRNLIATIRVTPESPLAKLYEAFDSLNIPIESVVALKVLDNGRVIVFYNSSLQTAKRFLPPIIAKAVLQAASQQSGLPIFQLRIVRAKYVIWPNGCLGLGGSDQVCTQALVPGWRVTVEGGQQRWVYRTNESGSLVLLEGGAGTIQPIEIPQNELPPPLPQGAVFRAITTGGIAGLSFETILQDDGRVIQVETNGTTPPREFCRISPQQLRQFQQLVESQKFARLNGLRYPEPVGSADFFSITFTSQVATVSYSDAVVERLPIPLENVIQAWNQILGCTQGEK